MVGQGHTATLVSIAFHHKLHLDIGHSVFLNIDGRRRHRRAVHGEVDRQAFHLLVALVDHSHHQIIGQPGLNNGRCQPHGINIEVGVELWHHRHHHHLHGGVGLCCRQVEGVALEVGIDKQSGSGKAMLLAKHPEAVHYLAHRHRGSVGVHAVELVEHLLLVHRILVLELETVGHQQVTVGGVELVHQVAYRLPCVLNHGGALRLALHAHRVVDINAHEALRRVDIQLFLGTIREREGQHQRSDE